MKKLISYLIIAVLFLFSTTCIVYAQMPDYSSTKEKIYIQTDHVFYKPGDQLFFKLYLVNAQSNTPSNVSGVAYVEVLNPAGNVLQKMNYKIADGYTEGSFAFGETAVGGVYKLRAYTTWMQNERDSSYFIKEITVQKLIAPRILMKLDFPKKGYGAGDEVIADYSIRSLSNQPIKNYKATYTVSIGGKTLQSASFTTNADGKAQVKFNLPNDLNTNDGLLNITINYDAYTESISRSIPIVLNKIDLQFLPEGGTLVAGIPGNIAFRAVNEFGKPADVKGEIKNEKGEVVSTFESYHFGMGKFLFTPQPRATYTATITSPLGITEKYYLPPTTNRGVVMNVSQQKDKILVSLQASHETPIKLVGATKNIAYYSQSFSLKKGAQTIEIKTDAFPTGIAQLTLYTGNTPLAERLVFVNEEKILQVKIITDKEKYNLREKVTMHVKTTDENNKPIPSNLSLSVVDDKLWTMADDKQDHILSWLLMSSELKGKIEEPQFYFKKDEPKAIPALDLVMLTHGYRYFDFIDYVQQQGNLRFIPDQENILSGIIRNKEQQPVKANVYLVNTYGSNEAITMQTGEDGQFYFSGLKPGNYYQVIARSQTSKEQITVQVLQNGLGYNPLKAKQIPLIAIRKGVDEEVTNYAVKSKPILPKQEAAFAVDRPVIMQAANAQLNDVVVTGYGTQKRKNLTGSVTEVNAKELINNVNIEQKLAGKVAGLNVVPKANPGAAAFVQLRGAATLAGAAQPLLIMDGMPVENGRIQTINPNDVESITVLKDAAATAIYGSRAANGVLVINSKRNGYDKLGINLNKSYLYASQTVQAGGAAYAVARRFYAPVYTTQQTDERTDFRETIYWNPVVQTDKDGNATVEFYNSDAGTTFRAIAEGIGYNGKIGRAEATYAAQSAMSVDAKIPPYLTVGDKAMLPLVVKNNRTEPLSISLQLQLPKAMKAGDFSENLSIAPNTSQQILIPLKATAAMKDTIRFIVASSFNTEKLVLPISASDKGFPVIETFSGNASVQHPFTINKMVPGSLHSKLKLFTSVEGQLLDGIESMLREPYGCFEQTSSSTYPNLFVLKYLRESGKSNPQVERKALGYIEAGYKRLISFETAQNGFEWFGHTPPHEALTAYGLLEFTDMQEFINVDKQMLARTKEFLLSRRDGKGEFALNKFGLDAFASVPSKIANIYIVYALTQAGLGKEIQLEYETAVKKAVANNDGYQMSMMALAASNLKNEKDYEHLMSLLKDLYQKKDLSSETSVVNSRDASLKVEALSLYAMALARAKQSQVGIMAEVLTKILGAKSYYGFGSTQGTVLALNAIVTYAKLVGRVAENTPVQFAANGQSITTETATASLKEGANVFAVNYPDEKQTIPYNMEVAYNTFTPPNSPKAELKLQTSLSATETKVGETVRITINVQNSKNMLQPMAIAKVGIPAGLSSQPWQLKELIEKKQVAYYEIFDNYLVLYWMGFAPSETKTINLDLKAEIPGTYQGKASNTYLYYTPEHKHWNDGVTIEVKP